MKKLLLLSTLAFSIQVVSAQPVEYLFDNWYLQSFSFGNQEVFIDTLEDLQQGPTMFLQSDFTVHGNSFCNDYTGDYEFIDNAPLAIDNNFIPRNIDRGTEDCGAFEAMEAHFFIPFVEERTADIIVYTQNGDEKFMVLQYSHGYQVYVNFPVLKVIDYPLENIIVFPNPAQNELIIQSSLTNFESVCITDVNGRIVIPIKPLASKKIDISSLNSGMYFITITSTEGNITKKFIKN